MATALQEVGLAVPQKLAGKYLTFALNKESYAIDVLQVREIIRLTPITAVPQMPPFVRGVINLRGKIIPVIDLRLRFGCVEVQNTDQTCIIVVQAKLSEARTTQTGLIVDGVEEVINLAAGDIEEPPDFGNERASDYILGMAKVKGVVKTLVKIDSLIGKDAAGI